MRNALAHVPRHQHQMVAAVIRTAFVQETQAEAIWQWRDSASNLGTRFPKVQDLMEPGHAVQDVLPEDGP